MKTKVYRRPIERVTNINVLNWLYKLVEGLALKGYKVHKITHNDDHEAQQYVVTIFYSGNIFQRTWRKISQW